MSKPRPRLGRGLEALIPVGADGEATGEGLPQYVSIDQIRPSPEQQRRHFAAEQLRELADSIREHGILQPLLLRRLPDGFELIAGERRWRAAQQAGLTKVPAIVRGEVATQESLVLGLIENLQRENLDPIEEARGIQRLIESFGLTHEEAAARLGKHRVAISQALRLLNGCPALVSATATGAISAGHARALVGLPTAKEQEQGLKVVLARRLSVRQTEKWVQDYKPEARRPRPSKVDAGLDAIRTQLGEHWGGSVSIAGSPKKGRVTIAYGSPEELERLLESLLP